MSLLLDNWLPGRIERDLTDLGVGVAPGCNGIGAETCFKDRPDTWETPVVVGFEAVPIAKPPYYLTSAPGIAKFDDSDEAYLLGGVSPADDIHHLYGCKP